MNHSHLRIGLLCSVLATALTATSPGSAEAGVGVSPVFLRSTIEKSGQTLQPIRVTNTGKKTIIVKMRFAPLGHDMYGGPTSPKGYKYRGDKLLSVSPNYFRLKPGRTKRVRVKVKGSARKRKGGAYAIMYVLAEPTKRVKHQTVVAKTQVGVLFLLSPPRAAKSVIKTGAVFATQQKAKGEVTFYVAVQNKGVVHETVYGEVAIQGKTGTVAKVRLRGGTVLPTFGRYLQGSWNPPKSLPPGTYKLRATLHLRSGGAKIAVGKMKVIKSGELVSYRAAITKFVTNPVVKNRPIALEAKVFNQGNVAFRPVGKVEFFNNRGSKIASAKLKSLSKIMAGKRGTITGTLSRGLPVGTYRATLTIVNADRLWRNTFNTNQQVIEREVRLLAELRRFAAPSAKQPFVTIEVQNAGNVDVYTEGIVLVADSGGNIVGQIALERKRVAQKTVASYKRSLPEGLDSGLYELRLIVNYGGNAPLTRKIALFRPEHGGATVASIPKRTRRK